MPRIERTVDVSWDGNVARGEGSVTGETGAFTALPFSLPSRIAAAAGKTSPEELLAAAHAGCFTMSLANELSTDGTPPGHLDVRCTIVMDELPGEGHQIVGSNLVVRVEAVGVPEDALSALIERAHRTCPFSPLLTQAGAEVKIERA
jgi:lipoyl-dependent peroxiredoxin